MAGAIIEDKRSTRNFFPVKNSCRATRLWNFPNPSQGIIYAPNWSQIPGLHFGWAAGKCEKGLNWGLQILSVWAKIFNVLVGEWWTKSANGLTVGWNYENREFLFWKMFSTFFSKLPQTTYRNPTLKVFPTLKLNVLHWETTQIEISRPANSINPKDQLL